MPKPKKMGKLKGLYLMHNRLECGKIKIILVIINTLRYHGG